MKKIIAAILAAFMVLSGSFAFASSTIELITNGDGYTVAASHEMKEKHDDMKKKHGEMKEKHDEMMKKNGEMKHDHKMKEKHDEMMKKHDDMKHQHDQMKKEHKNHTTPEKKE